MVDATRLLQPHVRSLKMYEGVDPLEVLAQKAGIPADEVIRLNGNENPYGPSPRVPEALGNFRLYNQYPDPEQRRLRSLLSGYLGIGAEHIVAGNGCDEMIDLILRMFLAAGEQIVDPSPTFGMYTVCARTCGGEVVTVPRDDAFEIDLEAVRQAVDTGCAGYPLSLHRTIPRATLLGSHRCGLSLRWES